MKRKYLEINTGVHMGSCEWVIMGLVPQAVSARVTLHFVTIFSKTCNKHICGSCDIDCYLTFFSSYPSQPYNPKSISKSCYHMTSHLGVK